MVIHVRGAGTPDVSGLYYEQAAVLKNGAPVYANHSGFALTREVAGSGIGGWVIGRHSRAFYGAPSSSAVPPAAGWEAGRPWDGAPPAPTVEVPDEHEPSSDGDRNARSTVGSLAPYGTLVRGTAMSFLVCICWSWRTALTIRRPLNPPAHVLWQQQQPYEK